jgi:hypothetical protein
MKTLILSFGLTICAFGLFSFASTSHNAPETIIVDGDGNVFIFDDGGDCVIHLGDDPWWFGNDC